MVEINLLPWRSELRQRKNKIIRNAIIFFIAVTIVLCVMMQAWHLFLKDSKKPIKKYAHLPLMKYHYIGYFQQNKDFSALIQLPNGKTMDVHTGSFLGDQYGRVISVTEKEIVIDVLGQTVRILYAH